MPKETILVLDLEGTLISNAVSQFPRPGLWEFLEFCHSRFERIYLYTAVRDERCHDIVDKLIERDLAPEWFRTVPFIQWDRTYKDLANVPNATPTECLIIDDNRDYILDSQISQWVEIANFEPPYPDTDRELERIQGLIEERLSG